MLKRLPFHLMITVFACLFTAPVAHGGGIPVFDGVNYAQNVQASLDQIAKMAQQITEMQRQYHQLQQTYSAMTGGRGLGEIMNNPALRNYLPQDWKSVYDSIKSGGYSGLTGAARTIRDQNRVYDSCAGLQGEARQVCERQAAKAAQDKTFSLEAYDKATERLNQLRGLMGQVSATKDQKAALEMIGRMEAENALIQNEATRLQLYSMLAQSENELIRQQQREMESREFRKRGTVDFPKLAPSPR